MPSNLFASLARKGALVLAAFGMGLAVPAGAQVQTVDPDKAIDGDLVPNGTATSVPATPAPVVAAPVAPDASAMPAGEAAPVAAAPVSTTYRQDDLIGAAEGVFGKGAEGLARLIEDLLKKQGEPNAYIVGREAGGAVVVGLRYGSGTLHHKIEGEKPVYWTGPSLGLDLGANAANTFVLVYNLNDTEELYRNRFAAGEGQAYLIGGFHVSYLRRGDLVLIPVRAGAGLRLGLNAGYMKFSHHQKWMPF